jgi:hypothetical protein
MDAQWISRRVVMRARTHAGDDQKVETSADGGTMDTEDMKQGDASTRGKADRALKPTALTADDIAQQSAYESDQQGIEQIAAHSDRNKNKRGG